jgi:GntR family transcriptional regulator, rspAB operon transcriptional repressor
MATPMEAAAEVSPQGDEESALQLYVRLDPRRQVSVQVYEALKKAIVSLQLPPGSSISENRICRHIGVSRTPVREAIIRLVEDELIEVFPQKGSFVAPIKLSAVRVNHFSRKALELAVLRRAAERWGPAYGSKARFIVDRQGAALGAGDMDEFHALDEAFHRAFCVAADLEGVWTTIQIIKARVDRVHRLAAVRGRLPMVIAEHNAILDSLDSSDAEGALERLEYHLERAPTMLETMIGTHERYFVD